MTYTHECFVRFDDLDSYGHVNNVTFAEYLREARLAFLDDNLSARRRAGGCGGQYVVARQVINYRAQVPRRTEPLAVELRVTSIGETSFTLAGEIRDEETTFVTAETVVVAVEAGHPRTLRDDERQTLLTYAKEKTS